MQEIDPWIQRTRRDGIARAIDFIPRIGGMAAPVFDSNAAMTLALVALGYKSTFDVSRKGRIATMLLDVAQNLSRRMGFDKDVA